MAKRDHKPKQAAPEQSGAAFTPDMAVDDASADRAGLATLTRRADFLRAAKARRVPCPAFLLQARRRGEDGPDSMRVGFTCSKKVGNAVARNRAKRRLRAIAREILPMHGRAGWDYVLIGRAGATTAHDFAAMRDDLRRALAKAHAPDKRR